MQPTPKVNITIAPENNKSNADKGEIITPEKDNNMDLDVEEKDKDLIQPEFGDIQENNCVIHWFMWLITLIMLVLIVFKRNKNKKEIEAIMGRSED